jgi:hypothetical protein
MIKVKFAEMHNPIFVNGINLGMKLDPRHRKGLSLEYDRLDKELFITVNGVTTVAPSSSVAHYTPANETEVVEPPMPVPAILPRGKVKAQVWDPTTDIQNPPHRKSA